MSHIKEHSEVFRFRFLQMKRFWLVICTCILLLFTADASAINFSRKTDENAPEQFYLRTNLLSPLTNFGAEYCIGNNWSVGADYYFPWMPRNKNNKNCFQLLGWNVEGRYWFGKDRTVEDRLEGHSVGLSVASGYYDIERNFMGDQGEFVSVSADYLYSLPICKDRLHLEFTLGLGWIYSNVKPYEVFEDGGKAYKVGYRERFNWLGPTKAGVTLVVPIEFSRRTAR